MTGPLVNPALAATAGIGGGAEAQYVGRLRLDLSRQSERP